MYWIVFFFYLVVMPLAAFHALIYKRDHRAALGWIGIIIVFPIVGALIYFVFGINRLRSKARLFSGHHLPFMSFGFERAGVVVPEKYRDPCIDAVEDSYLAAVGGRVSGQKLVLGNQVQMLINGEQWFPDLIKAIDNAHRYVLLSSYLFSSRGVAADVVDALQRAAQRQVEVRVLIDGVGVWYSLRRAVKPLRRAGVKVALFLPPSLIPPSMAINLRNHRKIAVIDGKRGYFGGINVDQRHMVDDPHNPTPTEDIHFVVTGPAVAQLQAVFAADWYRIRRETLEPAPLQGKVGSTICRVVEDGPDETLDALTMTLIGIFAAARETITIMMPYFLPSREMVATLQAATLRGVKVNIILPEKSNLRIVDWACRNMLWELLIWHVHVYFKPAPFAHTKLITVDNEYVMGGSANIDARSLRLNFELGVEMFDAKLAAEVADHIDRTLATCRRVDLLELDKRPIWIRARDAFFWLFSSYL